jgi:hypothetical protein
MERMTYDDERNTLLAADLPDSPKIGGTVRPRKHSQRTRSDSHFVGDS